MNLDSRNDVVEVVRRYSATSGHHNLAHCLWIGDAPVAITVDRRLRKPRQFGKLLLGEVVLCEVNVELHSGIIPFWNGLAIPE